MTTISQPPQPNHAQANVSQSVLAKSPSPSNSGTISPHAAVPAPAARSYANATRKAFELPPAPAKVGTPGVTEPPTQQNTRPDSNVPAVPSLGAPTIVNGSNGMNSNSVHGDHSRKASVTLNASGSTSYLPNGGSVAKPGANNIQFGQIGMSNAGVSPLPTYSVPHVNQPSNSLSVSASLNPRITSPAQSPSPIPQPLQASGGKPPASLHGQANSLSFGNFGGDEMNSTRPGSMSQGGLATPNLTPAHMRRESSQSSHGEVGNPGMGPGQPRGFPAHAGRGRGYSGQYSQQMSYSPGQPMRGPVPNQPRGSQNMAPSYQNQGRPMSQQYPNSPHLGARSPAPTHSTPMHPQPGQLPPMQSPQMHYAQHQYGPYGQPMGMPQNSFVAPPGYDPYGNPYTYNVAPQQMPPYMSTSPRPPFHPPQNQHQYSPSLGQYPPQQAAPPMSRTPSGVSERPNPVAAPPASMTPSQSNQSVASTRATSISTPRKEEFKIPSRASAKLNIVNPTTKVALNFEKQPASPAPTSTRSPANVSTPTPPPGTPIHSEHHRTDSKSIKTDAEKKNEMRDLVAKRIEDARLEEQRLKDEEAAKVSKEKEEAEAKIRQEREEAEMKAKAAAKEKQEAEEAAAKAKAEEEAAEALAKEAAEKAEQERKQQEEDEEFARMEEEMERKEREAEERYLKKKAAEREEKARKEAEEAANAEENLKKAEREAEAAEEARLQKLEAGEGEESRKERISLFAALKKTEGPSSSTDSPAAATPAESGTATPVSDSSSMAPPPRAIGNKQKPLPLTLKTTKEVEAAQPSAALQSLRSARFLQDVKDSSLYPSGIMSPNPALNSAAPMGKFKYDKAFLLQFQKVFVEKPSETWVDRVKETVGDTSETPTRTGPTRTQSSMGSSRQPSQRPNLPPSFGPMGSFGGPAGRGMPNQMPGGGFQRPMPGPVRNMTQPNMAMNFPMGPGQQMGSRNPSNTGMSHPHSPRAAPSNRGGAGGSKKGNQQARRDTEKEAKAMPLTAGMELKPIQVSATGWKPMSVGASAKMSGPPPGGDGYLAPDIVQRKVKAALNKMTPNNFDKIAAQILEIVEQSKKETDGRTLRQVIQLTFEKATDEAHWAGMYANFCSRMLEYMTPEIRDETLPLDKNGNVNAGVPLFRKYLLNRCQAEFEQGWETKLPEKPEGESDQTTMLSDEYYIAAAAKRRGLGLVRFIGELYKLSMLTSRIMHMCVKKLLDFEGLPGEAEVESLTNLLKTVGVNLDSEDKMRPTMDAYFDRMNRIINTEGLPSRLRFMLMDIVDLRSKQWRVKGGEAAKGPQTIEQIHEQAAAAEREKEQQRIAESSRNRGGGGGPRMPMGRGDARNFSGGGNQYGMPPPDYSRNTLAASDLQRLKAGSRQPSSQGGSTSFGPSSMFSANRGSNTRRTLAPNFSRGGEDSGASSRTGTPPQKKEEKETTSNNAFSALASLNSESNDATSPPQTSAASASTATKAEGGSQGKADRGDAPSS